MTRSRILILITALFAASAIFVRCDGTRFRDAELDVSLNQVDSNLTALQGFSTSSISTNFGTMLSAFMAMRNEEGASIYYGQAPSAMVNNPANLADFNTDWSGLIPPPPAPPSSLQIYYVHTAHQDGFRGGLIIVGNGINATVNATPNPSASPITPPPAGGQQFAYIAINDGNTPLPDGTIMDPGSFSDTDYQIEMNWNGTNDVFLQTYDLADGDLAQTIQFSIYQFIDGQQYLMGRVNLTQPQ